MSKKQLNNAFGRLVSNIDYAKDLPDDVQKFIVDNPKRSIDLLGEAIQAELTRQSATKDDKIPEILWQNGPHKVVKNDNGTISAFIDCDLIVWNQSNQDAIRGARRKPYINKSVVESMPKGPILSGMQEIVFRNFGRYMSEQSLAEQFTDDEPMASPFLLAQVNRLFPEFANKYPNGTHWGINDDPMWRFVAFRRWGGGRRVDVGRNDDGWDDFWWFPGLRKT